MAVGSLWQDKIGSALFAVALSALGAIAYQSGRYMFVDYKTSVAASQERIDEVIKAQHKADRQWQTFKKAFDPVFKRAGERDSFITESLKLLRTNAVNESKLNDSLRQAYADLGTISFVPASGNTMQLRTTQVEELRTQIEALELLDKRTVKKLTLTERAQVGRDSMGILLRLVEGINATKSALLGEEDRLRDEDVESAAALEKYESEVKQVKRWLSLSGVAFGISCFAYILLLQFALTAPSKSQEAKAAAGH